MFSLARPMYRAFFSKPSRVFFSSDGDQSNGVKAKLYRRINASGDGGSSHQSIFLPDTGLLVEFCDNCTPDGKREYVFGSTRLVHRYFYNSEQKKLVCQKGTDTEEIDLKDVKEIPASLQNNLEEAYSKLKQLESAQTHIRQKIEQENEKTYLLCSQLFEFFENSPKK